MNRPLLRSIAPALAVFLLGVSVAAASGWWFNGEITRDAKETFQSNAERTLTEVTQRFKTPFLGVHSVKALYTAHPTVPRAEFRAFIEARNLEEEFPGVRGFGFIERVTKTDLAAFVTREQADEAPQFAIRQLADKDHDDLYVIKRIEPARNNVGAQGLDLGSEALRRAAAERAVDTGEPSATGAITLVQDSKKTPGVLLFVPVYAKGAPATTVQERQAALVGLAYAPVVIAELLHALPDVVSGKVDFEIYDSPPGAPLGALMFDADNHVSKPTPGQHPSTGKVFTLQQPLSLAGRAWTIAINSTPKFDASISRSQPWLVFAGISLLSALLAVVLFQQSGGRRRAEASAQSMTADLQSAQRENDALVTTLNLHAIVSVSDRAGCIVEVNDAFCAISGYAREALLGQNHRILNSGVQTPAFWVDMWKTISSGLPWRGQVCDRAKDGSLYWVDTLIAPFIACDGQIAKYISIRTDITANKQAEEALRWGQSLMQMMSNSSPLAFLVVDNRNDNILYFNHRFCEIWGIEHLEERMGRGELKNNDIIADCLPVLADIPAFAASCAPLQDEANRITLEDEIAFTHNRTIRRYSTQIRDADDQYFGRFYIFEDVTAHRRHEADAQRNADLLRGSIDALDEAFVIYDPQDRLVLCNEKYREVYSEVAHLMVPGAQFEDIIRTGAETGHYVAANGRVDEWVTERLAIHLAANTTVIQKLSNGRTLRIVERRLPDGHIVGFRIDISELIAATEAAQAASQSKSQFLANMSHEIRTPMNAILGMLALLEKSTLSAQQDDYVSKTKGAAHSLLGLLNDILDLSKVEAGKMTLDPQPFRLDRMLRDLSTILSAYGGDKPVEVLYDIDPALPEVVCGDTQRLAQVLINLAGNAVKFTAQGEVIVRLQLVHTHAGSARIAFAVQDSGIGIAVENQAHIFSGFTQAEASTTRKFGGTGLGLSISQQLVGLMGGSITLASVLGHGSTFAFELQLPHISNASDIPAELVVPSLVSAAARSVLVIDDNPIARRLTAKMTQSWHWPTDTVAGCTEALERMREHSSSGGFPYAVVYVDWQMPGFDGWETARRVRALSAEMGGARPVIVMMSSQTRESLAERTIEEQSLLDGFLVKPFTASMLQQAALDADSATPRLRQASRARGQARQLTGMRVLVVEDNLINQQVAKELLASEGALVSLAANGQLGVDAVAAAHPQFDVVLMDIQMPVMDGYTATQTIRSRLGLSALPIVAMTANAMASDREECLVAGMTEHIGKPFDLPKLVQLLLHLTRHAGNNIQSGLPVARGAGDGLQQNQTTTPTNTAPNTPQPADEIDVQSAISRMSGLESLYLRCAKEFVMTLATTVEDWLASLPHNPRQALIQMHTLKGTAALLGANRLAVEAGRLEKLCQEHPTAQGWEEQTETLRRVVRTTQDAMQAVIDEMEVRLASSDDAVPPVRAVSDAPGVNPPAA